MDFLYISLSNHWMSCKYISECIVEWGDSAFCLGKTLGTVPVVYGDSVSTLFEEELKQHKQGLVSFCVIVIYYLDL